ncbi:uncharacterized protein LAJ45_05018 [Morchella importuna]|uniref:uncharacterized protein n=1 Tax=Morchella importuna TaxID=1174673 RepID=UPI001E8DE1AE|nr:uncharacterized protein LAJ45_05018 [Morchella importuna]KAH8150837.1 hypothetical protein LAJ45_05018 [Morchella importuna]
MTSGKPHPSFNPTFWHRVETYGRHYLHLSFYPDETIFRNESIFPLFLLAKDITDISLSHAFSAGADVSARVSTRVSTIYYPTDGTSLVIHKTLFYVTLDIRALQMQYRGLKWSLGLFSPRIMGSFLSQDFY